MKQKFELVSSFNPTGDQPQAIEKLVGGLDSGLKHQVLLGVTGSGKTFTMANVIQKVQRPTLIISHNKTLAAQLYQEFREFFPKNAVEYFVSYYDYYQPEAYIPQTDTYIEKETQINQELDKLRLSATTSLLTRRDVIVVASVSCIYNLGSPKEYAKFILPLEVAKNYQRKELFLELTKLQYERNDYDLNRGAFRVRGDTIEICPAYEDNSVRLEFLGDKLEKIIETEPINGKAVNSLISKIIYPAKHYLTSEEIILPAMENIKADLEERIKGLKARGKELYAERLKARTLYDLEMIQEVGYCIGIENYSRYFDGRKPGEPPYVLLDYFPRDYLLIIDESHITIPQIRGMYRGDRSRKETLIDFGFRLPSALDNRPLKFNEFMRRVGDVVYASATPDEYELSLARSQHPRGSVARSVAEAMERKRPAAHLGGGKTDGVVEQLIRPTGILDPAIEIRPTAGQVPDLIGEIKKRVKRSQRVLVTTLTKRMAEDLAEYLKDQGIKVQYLHSEIETLERSDILAALRRGEYDVLVGINLLREGLDLPEVSLVAILDADREGFLRSRTSLIQVMGRTARHLEGMVLMYADVITKSMDEAIKEVERRRKVQEGYNLKHGIAPRGIEKPIRERLVEKEKEEAREEEIVGKALKKFRSGTLLAEDKEKIIKNLECAMRQAGKELNFERAIRLRDQINILKV